MYMVHIYIYMYMYVCLYNIWGFSVCFRVASGFSRVYFFRGVVWDGLGNLGSAGLRALGVGQGAEASRTFADFLVLGFLVFWV